MTCPVRRIKYSKIFWSEYFNNKSVTSGETSEPTSKNIRAKIFIPWLARTTGIHNSRLKFTPSIHYFRKLALDLKLIIGQANLQLRPDTYAYSLATTTKKTWSCSSLSIYVTGLLKGGEHGLIFKCLFLWERLLLLLCIAINTLHCPNAS